MQVPEVQVLDREDAHRRGKDGENELCVERLFLLQPDAQGEDAPREGAGYGL